MQKVEEEKKEPVKTAEELAREKSEQVFGRRPVTNREKVKEVFA